MKRGELWTISGGSGLAGKPRPAVIVQDNAFAEVPSVVVCPFTTSEDDPFFFRILIEPSARNGLRAPSRVMADKIAALPRSRLGRRLGTLTGAEMEQVDGILIIFLGLAG